MTGSVWRVWKCHFDSAVGAVSTDTDRLHVALLLEDPDPVHHHRYHHYPHTNTNISVHTYLRQTASGGI